MPSGLSHTRRSLLQGFAALPLAAAPARATDPRVTVTGLEVFHVKVNRRGNWMILRVETSAGVRGLGDASQGGQDETTLQFVRQFFDALKGRSIYDVEWFRGMTAPHVMEHGRPAAVAASALEQTLWDIRGKVFSLPIHELFGGRIQPRIRNYANINRSTEDRTPAGFAQMAERALKADFNAVKLAPFDSMPRNLRDPARIEEFTRQGIACAEAVRHTIGPKADLLIDAHSHFNLEHGLDLARRFEPLNLFWLEEVTPAKPVENLAAINRAAKMPTAGGESIYGVKGFYPYIKAEAVDIVMPDVKFCGGALELKKIAAIAEGAGLLVAPHGPASPVGNAIAAQIMATAPNFTILEFSYGEVPWRAELIEPAEEIVDSCLTTSGKPGLGIELNEKTAARYAVA